MDQLDAALEHLMINSKMDKLSTAIEASSPDQDAGLMEIPFSSTADTSPPRPPPRTKSNSKQAKKERKLLQAYVQKVLMPKLKDEPELADALIRPENFEISKTYRTLLVDNRDYQIQVTTEELLNRITDFQVDDCFVLPSKVWLLLRFASKDDLIGFKRSVINGNSSTGINQISSISDQIYELTVERYLPEVKQIIEAFNPAGHPTGLQVIEDFIDAEEEQTLIRFAEQCFKAPSDSNLISRLKNRESVHFGHVFDYTRNTISSDSSIAVQDTQLPVACQPLLDRFLNTLKIPESPDQLTINKYRGGPHADHIPPHVDTHSMCTEWIVSVSIGSATVMAFTCPRESPKSASKLVSLPPRSALVMSGEARYLWRHAIPQTAVDMRPLKRMNTPTTSQANDSRLSLSPRDIRYSFTFRKIRPSGYECKCAFPESCDSQTKPASPSPPPESSSNEPITESRAVQLEREYVHRTYDQIASHFSATRYGQWPSVVDFLSSLATGSLVLDVGCGNGKYLSVQPDRLLMLGSDRSANLLDICTQRGFETFQDDVLTIGKTIRGGLFDAVICIAVIHHLATEERRLAAVKSLLDLLTPGGRALIYVWAFEQKKDGTATKYLKDKSSPESNDQKQQEPEEKNELTVHQNRTEFKKQDLFVPWKRSGVKKADPDSPPELHDSSTALRFYHVFREGELKSLLSKLEHIIELERLYYDQGNWCAICRKRPL